MWGMRISVYLNSVGDNFFRNINYVTKKKIKNYA